MEKIIRPKSKQPIPENAKKVFKGILFDVYQWEQKMFDGTKTTFEKLKRPDTVVIFPVLPDGKIILIKEQQPGTKLLLGAISGRIEKGESVLKTAKRELLEESGYKAIEFILWHINQPVNKVDWSIYVFVAKGLKKVAKPNLDRGERINLKLVTFDEFIKIAANEKFNEPEIVPKLLEAKVFPEKMIILKKLFSPEY